MTALDILTAAVNGTAAPRIPVFCNLLDHGSHELGMSQREYYSKGEHVAEGQLRLRARYGYDNVWSLFYVGKEAELLISLIAISPVISISPRSIGDIPPIYDRFIYDNGGIEAPCQFNGMQVRLGHAPAKFRAACKKKIAHYVLVLFFNCAVLHLILPRKILGNYRHILVQIPA